MRAYSVEGKRKVVRMATRAAMVAPLAAGAGVFASSLIPATAASASTATGLALPRPNDVGEHCNSYTNGAQACGWLVGSVGAHNQSGGADGFSSNNDCHHAELYNANNAWYTNGIKICGPHYIALASAGGIPAGEYYSYIWDDTTGKLASSLDIGQMKN